MEKEEKGKLASVTMALRNETEYKVNICTAAGRVAHSECPISIVQLCTAYKRLRRCTYAHTRTRCIYTHFHTRYIRLHYSHIIQICQILQDTRIQCLEFIARQQQRCEILHAIEGVQLKVCQLVVVQVPGVKEMVKRNEIEDYAGKTEIVGNESR